MIRYLLTILCFLIDIGPGYSAENRAESITFTKAFIESNYEPGTAVHHGAVLLLPSGNSTDVLNRIECENGVSGNVWFRDDLNRYLGKNETLTIPPSGLWIGPSAGFGPKNHAVFIDDAHLVFRNLPEHLPVEGHVKCHLSFERAGRIDVDFAVIRDMEQLISF